jgi:hypothetical protein
VDVCSVRGSRRALGMCVVCEGESKREGCMLCARVKASAGDVCWCMRGSRQSRGMCVVCEGQGEREGCVSCARIKASAADVCCVRTASASVGSQWACRCLSGGAVTAGAGRQHGDDECQGNKIIACMQSLYPVTSASNGALPCPACPRVARCIFAGVRRCGGGTVGRVAAAVDGFGLAGDFPLRGYGDGIARVGARCDAGGVEAGMG